MSISLFAAALKVTPRLTVDSAETIGGQGGPNRDSGMTFAISLPKLNGIEAAWRIRQLSPHSKIIFLSQLNSLGIVQEALSTGALGYIYVQQD